MIERRSSKTMRLDARVMELGLFPTREAAQTAIMDGGILVDGQKATKPGMPVSRDSVVEVSMNWGPPKYVSRGGIKLERAIEVFGIETQGRICLDIGASTGGFTDCLLKSRAAKVYAIDVGYGQLDWSLRNDTRVIVKERINARHLMPDTIYAKGDPIATLAVMDVSFISISKILPACLTVLGAEQPEIIGLIKPQFEAGRTKVGKGGVVKSPIVHQEVISNLIATAEQLDLSVQGLTHSPIKGPAGNIEFLVHWMKASVPVDIDIEKIVNQAHSQLN